MNCASPALLQRQRSWQGQNGWPAEVKARQDKDEADLDTPRVDYVCIRCSVVLGYMSIVMMSKQ